MSRPPLQSRPHPSVVRGSSRSMRNLIESMPITGREFATSCSKQDLLVTMDSNRTFSIRNLDIKSREFAAKSSRALVTSRELSTGGDDNADQQDGGGCCGGVWKSFDQDPTAKGYAILGICRGTILMSNVFLSSSLIFLASVHAGCVDENDQIIDNCQGKAYGFNPSSLITNIAVISGLLAAFFVPVLGAVIDYTPHRRKLGIVTAIIVTVIQAVQIGTVQATWFPMALLQALVGFIYYIQSLATFAYLPEMARYVGGEIMNQFTKWFIFIQFASQILFLLVIIVLGYALGLDSVQTGQSGQALSSICLLFGFGYAWTWKLPNRPAARKLPEGHTLWLEGFRQNYRTITTISKHYTKGLKWFMLTSAVAEGGVSALLPVGITFLTEEVKFDALQIGVVFAIALLTSLAGSVVGAMMTTKFNPRNSWIICLAYFVVVTFGGTFALVESRGYLGYVWGGLWGFGLGWFYPVENLMFSLCLPRGSENEMTGLFMYTNQILAWLPPFVFSVIIEAGADTRWGFLSLIAFQAGGIAILLCMSPWEEVLEEADKIVKPEGTSTRIISSPGTISDKKIIEAIKEEEDDDVPAKEDVETSGPEKGGETAPAEEAEAAPAEEDAETKRRSQVPGHFEDTDC